MQQTPLRDVHIDTSFQPDGIDLAKLGCVFVSDRRTSLSSLQINCDSILKPLENEIYLEFSCVSKSDQFLPRAPHGSLFPLNWKVISQAEYYVFLLLQRLHMAIHR